MSKTTCPNCGESKERLAGHWRFCGYPMLSATQRAVLRGLLLAGATVAGNGTNRHVTIGTASAALASWTADQLGWLCHSVREVPQEGGDETVHRVRTAAHPQCNRFERWEKLPENSGRAPPADTVLDRTTARVWWAYAGGLEWSGPYNSQRRAAFSAERDVRAGPLRAVLERAGYNPTRAGKRLQLFPTEAEEWLAWIGDPVPGSEHKWASTLIEYQAMRQAPDNPIDHRVALSRAAIEVAGRRTDKRPLTPDLFDKRVSAVSATEVADTLGGGSFTDAVATVDHSLLREQNREQKRELHTLDDLSDAVTRVRDELGEWPDTTQYQEHREPTEPTPGWFYYQKPENIESWDELIGYLRQNNA